MLQRDREIQEMIEGESTKVLLSPATDLQLNRQQERTHKMAKEKLGVSGTPLVRPGDTVAYRMPNGAYTPALALTQGDTMLALRVFTTSDGTPSAPEACAPEFTVAAPYGTKPGCWAGRDTAWPESTISEPSAEEGQAVGDAGTSEIPYRDLDKARANLGIILGLVSKMQQMMKNGRIVISAPNSAPEIAAEDLKNFPEMLSAIAIAQDNVGKAIFPT